MRWGDAYRQRSGKAPWWVRARVLELCFSWITVSTPQSTLVRNRGKKSTKEEAALGFSELLLVSCIEKYLVYNNYFVSFHLLYFLL